MRTFVGRARELELLAEIVGRASTGPAAAVVIGEPGSGKSRLLAEAQARARLPQSFAVVGYEPERRVPLAAAAVLLRQLTAVPGEGARLEALVFGGDDATALGPVRIFEAAHRACRALDSALLVIDDLQWMDELSYALCHYLIRGARDAGQRLAVLAATRPVEGGVALVDALPPERVSRLELAPLSLEEGVELAVALDASLDHAGATELYDKARGSPFWLEAMARTGGAGGGPGRLLTFRLRGAGPDACTLLGLLAVAGRPLRVADAAGLAGWPLERVEAARAELVARGIAHEASGAVRLWHDLIREAAVADLPEDGRREIHRSFAERLEAEAGDDLQLLREALEHRRSAGLPTLDLAIRLARSPRRTLLGPDGLRLLGAIADAADPLDADALTLQEEVASLATEIAAHAEALARWLVVADGTGTPLRRAAALLAASRAAFALDRVDEARDYLARAGQVEVADDVLDLEQRTHEAAIRLWLELRTEEGRSAASEAVAAATRLAAEAGGVTRLAPRSRRAYLDAVRLEYEAAMQAGDSMTLLRAAEAREAAARGFELEPYLAASLAVAGALNANGRPREAADRFRRLWDEAHRHVLPRLAVDAGFWLSRSLEKAAELVDAEEVVRETSELAARAGDVPRARHRIARVACSVALERGRPRAALRRLEHEADQEQNTHQAIAFHQDVAVWHARLDGPAAAATVHARLETAKACAETVGCPRCRAELLLFSSEALSRIGDRRDARAALARWAGRPIVVADEPMIAWHVQALAERTASRRAASLGPALAAAEESSSTLIALWIALDRGRALAEAGEASAVAALERTADRAAERGALTVQELAEHALRSLGVRTWRRGTAGAPLTRREEEVGRLLAGGATNREIAETLFLSPKTVERHVSNAFRKVGARNRTELAERLRRLGAETTGNPR